MLAPQADRVMTLGEWEDRWQENRIGFHQSHVHKMLENNFDKVLAGRTGVRFFFPLCGKAVDMKWLADMGHSVVGVEISEKAIQQFFEENNMTYIEEPVPAIPGAKVYKSSEKNISLYQCDLYNFSSSIEGQFGAIWDRGSLVAINPKDREKYAALIISLMASDCRYLLDTLLYNPELYKGPPFFVPDEQVTRLFGERCDIELLQSVDALTDRQRAWGLDYLTETVSVLPTGRWVWSDESQTLEFVSSAPAEEGVLKKRRQTNVNFNCLQHRSECVEIVTEHQMMEETMVKLKIAQKKLAVCYFSLIMDLDMAQHRHTAYRKGQMSPNSTEWLLHACLYSFFCYVAWVTFGRKDLRDIQEEVGRLLYTDTFNIAVRNRTDGDSGMTSTADNGSVKTRVVDPKETGCNSTFKQRVSQRRPALSSIVNQRSPLMVSLLPSPKEQSPHLFSSSRTRRQSPLQAEHCDSKALTEELNQQLASVSFGILGKPLKQFSHSTLIPYGEQKNNRDEDGDDEPENHANNNSEDRPGIHVEARLGSRRGFAFVLIGYVIWDTRSGVKPSEEKDKAWEAFALGWGMG
eukprot:superscaffoldBa00000143_g2063